MKLVSLIAALVMIGGSASAQSVRLDRLHAPGSPEDDFGIRRALVLPHKEWGLQLHVSYANDPLVIEQNAGDPSSEIVQVVSDQVTGTIGGAIGLFDRVMIYASVPVTWQLGEDKAANFGIPTYDEGVGISDVNAGLRLRVLGNRNTKHYLSIGATVGVPIAGDDQNYRGEEKLTVHPELLFDFKFSKKVILSLNAGFRYRQEETSQNLNLEFSNEVTAGLGLGFGLWQSKSDENTKLNGYVQAYGVYDLDNDDTDTRLPIEALAGIKFQKGGLTLGAAAGPGLTRGFGSPDVRILGMIAYKPVKAKGPMDSDGDGIMNGDDECPNDPEDKDGFEDSNGCPDPDNDKDGILDTDDKCPMEAGTAEYEGCPERDSDGDGIMDGSDKCPSDPEDADGFEDEDGCPDPDNDKDGVLDADDACPLKVGPADNKGCPQADRDGDTVIDAVDVCPDVPGKVEYQGCPKAQKVKLTSSGIEILEKVYFRTSRATIRSRSYAVLNNVAEVLNKHPEITKIIVEGHTDSRGSDRKNKALSQRRADAVVKYLVKKGVDRSRLEAQGWGEERLKIENARSKNEHAQNRRVEFNIPKTSGIDNQSN